LIVEHLARIAKIADMDACLFEILVTARQAACGLNDLVIIALACDTSSQIERVELSPGMTEQMGEAGESFGVSQLKGVIAVANSPILAVFAENSI
jgi:hypothetical protein